MSSSYVYPQVYPDEDLGFIGLTAAGLTSAVTAAGGPAAIFDSVKDLFGGIFGGGSNCNAQTRQKKQQIAASIRKYLTPQDMRELTGIAKSNIAPNPGAMAKFYIGGHDCKHKNVSPGDKRFLSLLPQRITQRMQEAQQAAQQTAAQNANGSPAMAAVGGKGLAKYAIPVAIGIGTLGIGGLLLSRNDKDSD